MKMQTDMTHAQTHQSQSPDPGSQPVTEMPYELRSKILQHLHLYGFIHLTTPMSQVAFETLAQQLGTIELRTHIRVDSKNQQRQQMGRSQDAARPGVYQAASLGLHTDRPTVNILAWYCIEQDDLDGTSLLVDTQDLPSYFTAEEISMLNRIQVKYSTRDAESDEEITFTAPLLSKGETGYRIYYAPWRIQNTCDTSEELVLEKFSNYLKRKSQDELLEKRLKQNQCLFIDNQRILHGRRQLPENSRRHLIRFYIKSPDYNL